MRQYGYTPKQFRFSKLIPIPKNKRKSLNDSTKYRAIALSSIFGKVFDWVILEMYKNNFHTSDLQHGFKKGLSTMTCTYVLDEVVNYYNKNNTKVYALLLDASKAFDRVHYLKLFHTLVDKEMCPLLIRFLIDMYLSQTMCVAWRNTLSNHFSASNGVKQGGGGYFTHFI